MSRRRRAKMAVTKLWPVGGNGSVKRVIDYAANPEKTKNPNRPESEPNPPESSPFQSLSSVLAYATNASKTEQEFFVEGINCNPDIVLQEFMMVKNQFGKTDGIQAYHGYMSFKETELTPETAQKIGKEFAERVWGNRFQVLVTTHLNTGHLHCHFVINSVSFQDGKRLAGKEKAWFSFRHIADEVCEKYHLYYNAAPNRAKNPQTLYAKEAAGLPTRYTLLKKAIDDAISCSKSPEEFDNALRQMGYIHQLSPSRKYWTVIPKGYNKPVRLKNLGEEYTNEAILRRLKENEGKVLLQPFWRGKPSGGQYRLSTRGTRIRKKGGIAGLYLYYCYKLGVLPKYTRQSSQNRRRLHAVFREELTRLDQLTQQTQFIAAHRITDEDDLNRCRQKIATDYSKLSAKRNGLRNQARRKSDEATAQALKEEIAAVTKRIQTLRKELNLCNGIAERSELYQDRLQAVSEQENKTYRKGEKPR